MSKNHRLTKITIMILVAIVGINYLVMPLVSLFKPVSFIKLPEQFWTLLTVILPSHLGVQALNLHLPTLLNKSTPEAKNTLEK